MCVKFYGVIILESLLDQSIMDGIDIIKESDVMAPPDDPYPIWSRRLVSISSNKVEKFAELLSLSMKEDFYNHFVDNKTLIVVFKGRYYVLDKKDKTKWNEMINYGETVRVGSKWTINIPIDKNNLLT
jgi:hypothetical protein